MYFYNKKISTKYFYKDVNIISLIYTFLHLSVLNLHQYKKICVYKFYYVHIIIIEIIYVFFVSFIKCNLDIFTILILLNFVQEIFLNKN